jgi:diguanylate cyclase (GGDEF)-like protein
MPKLKLNKNVIWLVLLILIVLSLLFGVIINGTLKDNLETDALNNLEKDTEIISENVNTYFSEGYMIVKQMLTNEVMEEYILTTKTKEEKRSFYRVEELVRTLQNILLSHTELLNVWLGIEGINDLLTNDINYDSRSGFVYDQRPWYLEMNKNSGVVTFASPYTDFITNETVISVVSPVYNENEIAGAVGIDLSIDKVEKYIQGYQIGEAGSACLLSHTGELIVTPMNDVHGRLTSSTAFDQVVEDIISHENGVRLIKYNDQAYYIGYSKVEYPDWYVLVIVPEEEVFYNSFFLRLLDINSFIAVIVLFVLMFIMYKMRMSYIELDFAHQELIGKEKELRYLNDLSEAANNQLIASEKELFRQNEEIVKYNRDILKQQEYIKKLAEEDPLTGIPNRRLFFERLDESLKEGKSGLVIMIDLDNFKEINDVLGHVYGDEILRLVAAELVSHNSDDVFVSRFGGDEFLVLIEVEGASSKGQLKAMVTDQIQYFKEAVNKRYDKGQETLYIEGSLGVSFYPYDSKKVSDILKYADLAMYESKTKSGEKYSFYDEQMAAKLVRKSELEKILREAIENDGFELVYQPLIDSRTGLIKSFEALIRLKNKLAYPDEFIEVAEETGQIFEIGRWVLVECIRTLSLWKSKGFELKPIAINLSVRQVNDNEFINLVGDLLAQYDIEGRYVDIEVTESMFLDNSDKVIAFFEKLIAFGATVSLDDFGTGYSSLSYLDYIPLTKLKIDKYLVDKEYQEDTTHGLVGSIIVLAHNFGMEVVAEGVEEKMQYERLKAKGCDTIQGYYFSKPKPLTEINKIYNINFLD